MTYKISFKELAFIHLAALRKNDKNTYIKCFDMLLAIATDPRNGIGKPERMKGYGEEEVYSRRLNDKDRLVYLVNEEKETIEIIACKGHYDDK